MKSEHRHELQTNELGKVVDSMGGVFERYGNQIMIGVCTASIVAAGIIYWVRRSHAEEANAWTALSGANSPEALAEVASEYSSSTAAPWARLQAAETRLASGIQLMFTDREAALLELKGSAERPKCLEMLQSLVGADGIPREVRERALFSLGRCQETISDGNETAAIETYETLLREFPETVFKAPAGKSIADLKSGSAQEFYAWFSKQNPKPAPPPAKPADRTKGGLEELDDFDLLSSPLLRKSDEKTEMKPKKKTDKSADTKSDPAAASDPAVPAKDGKDVPSDKDAGTDAGTAEPAETAPPADANAPAKSETKPAEKKKDAPQPAP